MAYSNFYARFHVFLGKIKMSFLIIFRFRSSLAYLFLILAWQVITWLQAWFIHQNLSGHILVLHYNVDFGIDLVGSPIKIFLFPALGLAVFLLNFIILAFLHKDKNFKILAHFLLGAAFIFNLFLSVALLAVYIINFR